MVDSGALAPISLPERGAGTDLDPPSEQDGRLWQEDAIVEQIWPELIKIIPALLWFSLAATMLVLFRTQLAEWLARLGTVEAMGVKIVCMRESIDAALQLAEKAPRWKVDVSPDDKRRALDRARTHFDVFRGAQILWVDDQPENNVNERRMFRQMDVDIDTTTSNDMALAILRKAPYDLVISDIARAGQQTTGVDLAREIAETGIGVPVILYVGEYKQELGVPPYVFGITNRPDQLLHLTLDTLERKHGD
jgi:CheY-like chemotaxis protein